jgi:hypothetical protein
MQLRSNNSSYFANVNQNCAANQQAKGRCFRPDSAVALTATVKQTYGTGVPTGTVTFASGATNLGNAVLSNGTASDSLTDFGIPAGTYVVTASYAGDTKNAASIATAKVVIQ